MSKFQPAVGQCAVLPKTGLGSLVDVLRQDGFTVIGPKVCDGVVALRPIESAAELAQGVRDTQSGGRYRLTVGDPELYFQHSIGPQSPKRYLFPPAQQLFHLRVAEGHFNYDSGRPVPPKYAFIGLRACELAALAVLDRVFTDASRCESDVYYSQARRQMVAVAVNCTHPCETCFCASMGTGPEAKDGFDLSLTELRGGFVAKVGSAVGAQLAARLDLREATAAELELAEVRLERAREHMGRRMDASDVKRLLDDQIEHPRWDQVASRCLACGNCTMVCPTCFCSGCTDSSDLVGGGVSRTRLWDSCYMHQYSYTTAGPVRHSIRARYRHWLRHKLCTWHDQFDVSGCVGCGRCITWCPVGIDLTEEIAAIRGSASAARKAESEVSS